MVITDRVQEYITGFGKPGISLESELIPVGGIDKVPIQLVVAKDDAFCSYDSAKRMMKDVPAVKTMHTVEGADHEHFASNNSAALIEVLVNQIELDPYNAPKFSGYMTAEERQALDAASTMTSMTVVAFIATSLALF
jgi:hypothetical protein